MLNADEIKYTQCEIKPGMWAAKRPMVGPFISRLKDAYQVLRGKADAVKFINQ